ncbi:MAG: OB-fold nucleic acid binding domain-containing protein [Candidatus Pacearchaeota archaeon]|jgi:replication factor A1
MKISELKSGQGKANITATIKSIEEPRTFDKFGKQISVANAVIADESGEIKLTLWNQDIEKVKVGDIIKITNGYVNEFKGELQLTTGKFGKMEVLDKDNLPEESDEGTEEESFADY